MCVVNNITSSNDKPASCGERTGRAVEPMSHAEALSKAAKLLRLAQSDNPHEAALAAARAQEIMDRFKLTGNDLVDAGNAPQSNEPVQHFAADPLDTRTDRWRGQLAVAVAGANQCKAYRPSSGFALIGRASDVMACHYIYGWLTREIERLAETHCAGNGRTYWNNFRLGAVEAVSRKLRESAKQTVATVQTEARACGDNGRALAVVAQSLAVIEQHKKEVEDYGKNVLKLRAGSSSRTNYNPSAREAGRKAWATISIGGARGSLNGSTRQLH